MTLARHCYHDQWRNGRCLLMLMFVSCFMMLLWMINADEESVCSKNRNNNNDDGQQEEVCVVVDHPPKNKDITAPANNLDYDQDECDSDRSSSSKEDKMNRDGTPPSEDDDDTSSNNCKYNHDDESDQSDDTRIIIENDDDIVIYDTGFMVLNTWGKPQIVEDCETNVEVVEILKLIKTTKAYMTNEVLNMNDARTKNHPTNHCVNKDVSCSIWAYDGECENDRDFMIENCSPACLTCHKLDELLTIDDDSKNKNGNDEADDDDCDDGEEEEDAPANSPVANNQNKLAPIPWGVPQNIRGIESRDRENINDEGYNYDDYDDDADAVSEDQIMQLMVATTKYMKETVYVSVEYDTVYADCENRSPDCSLWAVQRECEENPAYMKIMCAPACQSCEYIDHNIRCPIDSNAYVAWPNPGDVNSMFERVVNDQYWNETFGPITIWSSPSNDGGPWIITIDNFLSEAETKRLIEFGYEEEFNRSTDVGEPNFDGSQTKVVSKSRTSENAWCPDDCQTDPVTGPAHDRIENLTGIPYSNAEWWQLLRYKPGQFYKEHHDYIVYEDEKPQGPRILTVFFYLNDVDAGGGTRFNTLNITVMPKRGRAVLWPSVRDELPMKKDKRTNHEALVVESGMKYGANVWFHQRDFKAFYEKGCT